MSLLKYRLRWLFTSAVFGIGFTFLAPIDWWIYAFLGACGFTLLMAIACSVDAKDTDPLSSGQQVFSYFLLGTESPKARVPENNTLVAFQCLAVLAGGLVAGMLMRGAQ